MNIRQIDSVIELARTLNFNEAARNLYISQPALSYQVRTLEDEIGFLLFDRSKGVTITPAGKTFCDRIKKIKEDYYLAIQEAKAV